MKEQASKENGFTPDIDALLQANEQASVELQQKQAAEAAARADAERAAHQAQLQEAWVGKLTSESPQSANHLQLEKASLQSFKSYLNDRTRGAESLEDYDAVQQGKAEYHYDSTHDQKIENKHPVELARALKDAIDNDDKTLENDVMDEVKRRAEGREADGEEFVQYFVDRSKAYRTAKAEKAVTEEPVEPISQKVRTEDARKAVEEAHQEVSANDKTDEENEPQDESSEPREAVKAIPPLPSEESTDKKSSPKKIGRKLARPVRTTKPEAIVDEDGEDNTSESATEGTDNESLQKANTPSNEDNDSLDEQNETGTEKSSSNGKVLPPMSSEKPAQKTISLKDRAKKLLGGKRKRQNDKENEKEDGLQAQKQSTGLGTRSAAEIRELTSLADWTDEEVAELQAEYQSQVPGPRVKPEPRSLVQRAKDFNQVPETPPRELVYERAGVPRTTKEIAELMFDDADERKAYLDAMSKPETKRPNSSTNVAARDIVKRGIQKVAESARKRKAEAAAQRREGLRIIASRDEEEERARTA